MKSLSLKLMALGVIAVLAWPALAEDKAEKRAARKAGAGPIAKIEEQVATLDLNDEQKKKVSDILANYKKKFADAQISAKGQLTKEQKQAQREATAKAKADGKKRKELQAEVDAAVKLTDEQKKARDEAAAKTKELQASLKKDLTAVLSAEQIEKLGLETRKRKKNT